MKNFGINHDPEAPRIEYPMRLLTIEEIYRLQGFHGTITTQSPPCNGMSKARSSPTIDGECIRLDNTALPAPNGEKP